MQQKTHSGTPPLIRIVSLCQQMLLRYSQTETALLLLQALDIMPELRGSEDYSQAMRFVLGHRKIAGPGADNRILELLAHDPHLIPEDCFADRLPEELLGYVRHIRE